VNLGLVAGDGAAVVLPVLIGPHRAKELLLTGKLITGTEAAAMGMINRAVPAAELSDTAYALAREYAAQPTYAARATKMAVNRYLRWMVEQTLDVSLAYEAISRELPEYPEAVEAWRQRRARRADEPRP
jgi:enoyl-CoA hydratase